MTPAEVIAMRDKLAAKLNVLHVKFPQLIAHELIASGWVTSEPNVQESAETEILPSESSIPERGVR